MAENEEMRGNIMRREAEIGESNAELAALQREAAELATELRIREAEGRRAEEQLAQTAPEVQLLRQQLAELRRLLDEQQLEKADMEDQMRRLQEDIPLAFLRTFCMHKRSDDFPAFVFCL